MRFISFDQMDPRNTNLLFTKSKNVNKVQLFVQELQIHILEANILLQTIQHLIDKKLSFFDSSVGDWKCQTRTSIILNIISNSTFINHTLERQKEKIQHLKLATQELLTKIQSFHHEELKQLTKELQTSDLKILFHKYQIDFIPHVKLKVASLLHFCTLNKEQIYDLSHQTVTPKKINKLLIQSKFYICQISIQYEQSLAKAYSSSELEIILQQVVTKGFCPMTSFFPSFKAILDKMKKKKESFIKKTIHFCSCGGIKNQTLQLYTSQGTNFVSKKQINLNPKEALMAIEGYQFSGPFAQLKEILKISPESTLISKEYFKSCFCSTTSSQPTINNIEETILANFVQHPQFINDAEIDWKNLELENSDLKKEFDHLKTVPGCSINDMSIFCIRHIYASTLTELFTEEQQESAQTSLVKTSDKSSV